MMVRVSFPKPSFDQFATSLYHIFPDVEFESKRGGPNLSLPQCEKKCVELVSNTPLHCHPFTFVTDIKHLSTLVGRCDQFPNFARTDKSPYSDIGETDEFFRRVDVRYVISDDTVQEYKKMGLPDFFPFHVAYWPDGDTFREHGHEGVIIAGYDVTLLLSDMELETVGAMTLSCFSFGLDVIKVHCHDPILSNRIRGLGLLLPKNRSIIEKRCLTNIHCILENSWDGAMEEEKKLSAAVVKCLNDSLISMHTFRRIKFLVESFDRLQYPESTEKEKFLVESFARLQYPESTEKEHITCTGEEVCTQCIKGLASLLD